MSEVPEPSLPDPNTLMFDSWDKAAKRLINSLWKCGHLFHNPVDPDLLGIPDYFDVVTDPIDLGTIK